MQLLIGHLYWVFSSSNVIKAFIQPDYQLQSCLLTVFFMVFITNHHTGSSVLDCQLQWCLMNKSLHNCLWYYECNWILSIGKRIKIFTISLSLSMQMMFVFFINLSKSNLILQTFLPSCAVKTGLLAWSSITPFSSSFVLLPPLLSSYWPRFSSNSSPSSQNDKAKADGARTAQRHDTFHSKRILPRFWNSIW